jgi:FtsP/CotA-like multicopper oxidase with cupredoxin domain
MKNLLWIFVLLMIGGLAFGQVSVPPCTPVSGAGCTDYFGVANWANSPLPAGAITGFTVKASGSGYSAPASLVISLTDVNLSTPMTITPTVTLDSSGGLATVTGTLTGSFIAPQITVTDMGPGWTSASSAATCGSPGQPACGSGAIVLANIGGTLSGGIHKFKDTITLPAANLQLAVPDTTTFPGSDYYVIGLKEYTAQMHSDLPPTRLRGYCQMNLPGAAGVCNASYLGPTIIATKNRPVRVLFKNLLPTGAGGNLFIPTDTTYMGAGMASGGGMYTQNRATLHLHGGATPWISDGTPHQWTAPAGEMGPARGASVQFVPDMWFDASGNPIASCAGQGACTAAGATNDPGHGNLTFFWTNQQGGRLMFYHDHAYGITRLNVYAGEAAGYLLVDPAEETALAAATVPGTITGTPDLAHLVPLVIQDKTFVPTAPEVSFEDPTWLNGFGTRPGFINTGDVWFPHIYTTNQNPADPGGANAFGRWDYGPWTLPGNQTVLLAGNPVNQVQFPCTSSAFPNQAINCPIIPNPSGTPEGFMDTPVVNGKAYPVLHVAPEAYRFQILAAGNDRSWNLQWYVADPTVTTPDGRTNTEVAMLPAIQPSTGSPLPLCTQITPITNTTLFMGLATGLLDSSGNPINGTGLPAGCWPNFGAGSQTAGIPVQQTMWAADGRAGGVPDPRTAGPPFIEIGTEGGLLPAPVVIPSMPIGYEANTRSVTITNVSVHGLWLGPAERADAVVDFSKFAGKTLILYNDAPTPAPAVDSRLDYFTGDGDQSPIGGAPNTLPGFGPNTRTLMQVIVDASATGAPSFQLSKLQAALPGIFAQTQPQIIVPEPTYPPASGGYSPVLTYSLITDATLTYFPPGSTTPVTETDKRKTIQELFTLDYGRMNATLGVELPLTNFLTQNTIPLGYIDPPTETIKQGDTQLWHITHNGVDTHFIHFHLFNVQVINRSGWDGTVRPPDQNELGWKDTVRMNPLEDILVALQPITPVLPWPVRDSYRLLDVTQLAGSDCPAPTTGPSPLPCSIMTDVNPITNIGVNTPNQVQDFGWEYVWHCHILGHEENDMMRAIQFQVPPEAPSNLTVAPATTTGLTLTFTDNSSSETGFTLQRDITAAFSAPAFITVGASTPMDSNRQGTGWGGPITFNDTAATGPGPYFYRVQAFKPDAAYWNPGPPITSAWSNVVSFGGTSSVTPPALAFGTVAIGTTPSPSLATTLSNTSATTAFTYTAAITGANAADFAVATNTCAGSAAAPSSCPIGVTFTPTLTLPESANLVITTTAPGNPTYTVSLTGTGTGTPSLIITANNTTMKYGTKALPVFTFSYNPANPAGVTTPPTCTTTATAASPVGSYPITCSGAVDASYAISYVAGTLTVTPVPLMIWGPNLTMLYGGTVPAVTPAFTGLVNGDTAATLAIAPNVAPACNAYVLPPPPSPGTLVTSTTTVGTYTTVCSGAADLNYQISYTNGTFTVSPAVLTITPELSTLPYNTPIPSTFNLRGTGLVNGDTLASLGMTQPPITCTTTATTVTPQPPSVGSYPITCTGPAQAPPGTALYSVIYAPGLLTVSIVTPTVTFTGAPATAGYQSTFPVNATTNALGAVAPTITGTAGVCTVGPVTGTSTATATVTLTSGTGTCVLTANWAPLPPNYTGATAPQSTTATPIAPTVTFTGAPASANYQSTFTVATTTNASTSATVTASGACTIAGNSVTMTSGTGTCSLTASWPADANYLAATATQSTAALTIAPTVTFTGAPATANYQSTFTVASTTNATTTAVITASGACTVAGSTVTMTSGTGTCSLIATWAADNNYSSATATQSTGAAQIAPTVAFTGAPANAAYKSTFTVTATTNSTAVATIAAAGVCSIAGNVVTMTSGAGTCTLTANWPADPNYLAAGPLSQTTTATLAAPTVTFTGAPATAAYQSTFTVANTTNASTTATITASGACTISGNTVTMTSGTGTCSLTANWAADTNYSAATATQSTAAALIKPTVTFTGPPATANYQSTFAVATTTNASTTAVITAGGACTISGNTVTMTSGTGTCSLTANWAADANYSAATLTQSTAAAKIAPTVTFTAPATAVYNSTFTPAANSNASSPAVITATGVCSVAGNIVTMANGTGVCNLTANWAADANYLAATATAVTNAAKAPSTTAILSNVPNPAIVGQIVTVTFSVTGTTAPTGTVTVTASTGQSCSATLPSASCNLTFSATGKPTLTATYGGNANFNPSTSAAVTQVVSQVNLSTTSLLFGNQTVGTTSANQTVTLTNVGTLALTFPANPITITGPYSFTTTCPNGANLNAGRNCTITVRFTPAATGVQTGTVIINTSDAASPAVIGLSGTGVQPAATLSPSSNNFGTVTRGTTSAPFAFTLTAGGSAPLTINGITVNGGQFTIASSTCGTTLAVGSSCTINVAFSPKGRGAQTGTLQVSDNAPGSPQTATLTGTGQ